MRTRGLAALVLVLVSPASAAPQLPPSRGPSYIASYSDRWNYPDKESLRAAYRDADHRHLWVFTGMDSDLYKYLDLVPDRTFGQALRVTQPANPRPPHPGPATLSS